MKTYQVTVAQNVRQYHVYEIEAETEEQAEAVALKGDYNDCGDPISTDYDVCDEPQTEVIDVSEVER